VNKIKLRRDKTMATFCMFAGLILAAGSAWFAIRANSDTVFLLTKGVYAPERIERTRQTILEVAPTAENISKIAAMYQKRASEDAEFIQVLSGGYVFLTVLLGVAGVVWFGLSYKLWRYIQLASETPRAIQIS
jgi:hypothetical protein